MSKRQPASQSSTRRRKKLLTLILLLTILASLLPVTGQQASAQIAPGNLAFIILDGTLAYPNVIQSLKAIGAPVQHIFPPHALIGQIPPALSGDLSTHIGIEAIYRDFVNPDELANHGPSVQKASHAWNELLASWTSQDEAGAISVAQAGDEMVNDALLPPDLPTESLTITSEGDSDTPNYYQTSEFMIGTVAVGIILPESNNSIDPSSEDWTASEQQKVYSEIVAATNWWANMEPAAQLTFIYDDHFSQPVPTSYEPISRPQSDQGLWIGEVMGNIGYDESTSYFTRVRDYVNDLRDTYQTDWAFAIFVVDSSNDADNYFANGYFAYAYLGGPFMVMTYGNNGYGSHNMDAVAAHEMGHIFLALDQYSSAHVPCTTRAGYLDVENQNSLYGSCASNETSIMRGQVWPYTNGNIDHYAKGQIGWWDSDNDGLLDPVDTTTEIALTQESQPQAGQIITYTGSVKDTPFPSTRRRSVTINRITGLNYRLDGGDWQPVNSTDGSWNSNKEAFAFNLPPLTQGIYQLDLLVQTSLGGDRLVSAVDILAVTASGNNAPMQEMDEFAPNPTTDTTPTFTGIAAAVNSTIANVEYRIDGGEWQLAQATDGHFDQEAESFSFTTASLEPGEHVVKVRSIDFEGYVAQSCDSASLQILEIYTIFLPATMNNR